MLYIINLFDIVCKARPSTPIGSERVLMEGRHED